MPDFSYGASEKLQSEDWNILFKTFAVKKKKKGWGHERGIQTKLPFKLINHIFKVLQMSLNFYIWCSLHGPLSLQDY